MNDISKEWKIRALTPIWTGDADREENRLIPTGIVGSLRWWFEVLVRGLGGKACDPTSDVRCPEDRKKKPIDPGHHCVVCELFGCTGWARKFRLMVLDEKGEIIQNQIGAGQTFILRFIPLRPIRDEEWCLLDATLRLIADYGAIGGKTVFKPSDESNRQNAPNHKDFGLIAIEANPTGLICNREQIEAYVRHPLWRHNFNDSNFSWASLQNFWCVKGRYLTRTFPNASSFNLVVGRKEDKSVKERRGSLIVRWSDLLENRNDKISGWLVGRQQESKKVFSFKHPRENGRTFGFVKPGLVDFDEMKRRLNLNGVWGDKFEESNPFTAGDQVLDAIFYQEKTS
ncbi:MAG: type III-B CRISPR module RAMP protein Cmr1 [Chloroflexota bacterium]